MINTRDLASIVVSSVTLSQCCRGSIKNLVFPLFAEFKFSSRKTDHFHYLKAYLFPDFLPAGDICRKPLNKMFAIHFAILVTLLDSWLEVRCISSGHFVFYALY